MLWRAILHRNLECQAMNQGKLEVVRQEMARVNANILGISELKCTGMGEFNSDDYYIYYCGQESLRRNGVAIMVNRRVWNAVLGCNLKNDRMISVHFQGKPFNITVIQVYVPTSNIEEAEVEQGLGPGGDGDDQGWDGWMASLTRWTWVWVNSGVGDGQGGLACCDSWSRKESDMTEWLKWTELKWTEQYKGFPWHSSKKFIYQSRRCKRHGFDPLVMKIPWRRKWQPLL